MRDHLVEKAVLGVARQDGCFGCAPSQQRFAGAEVEFPFDIVTQVAFAAVLHQRRPHMGLEDIQTLSQLRGLSSFGVICGQQTARGNHRPG